MGAEDTDELLRYLRRPRYGGPVEWHLNPREDTTLTEWLGGFPWVRKARRGLYLAAVWPVLPDDPKGPWLDRHASAVTKAVVVAWLAALVALYWAQVTGPR
jgi:hypothetical protein